MPLAQSRYTAQRPTDMLQRTQKTGMEPNLMSSIGSWDVELTLAVVATHAVLAGITLFLGLSVLAIPQPQEDHHRIALGYFLKYFLLTFAALGILALASWLPLVALVVGNFTFIVAAWCLHTGFASRLNRFTPFYRSPPALVHLVACAGLLAWMVTEPGQQIGSTWLWFPTINVGLVYLAAFVLLTQHPAAGNTGQRLSTFATGWAAAGWLLVLPAMLLLGDEPELYTGVILFVFLTTQVGLLGGIAFSFLHDTVAHYQTEAVSDPLTGLHNRRYFDLECSKMLSQAERHNHVVSIVLIDIDHFKLINDSYGHDSGDRALVRFSRTIKDASRLGDLLARYGGEEFILLLPETNLAQARLVAERMRISVSLLQLESTAGTFGLTASFGITEMTGEHLDFESAFKCADEALFKAKSNGRNRVVTGTPAPPSIPDAQSDPA